MEDQYDLILLNYFGNILHFKRFFLPTAIMLPLFVINKQFQNNFYIFFSTFISIIIVGWNFPKITKLYYSRPIYFEDLDDDKEESKKVKNKIMYNIELSNKFKSRFIIFQQILISIACSLVIEYIVIKNKENNYNTMELFGLIGGLLSFLTRFVRICGKIFLSFLYYKKKKEKEKLLIKYNLHN